MTFFLYYVVTYLLITSVGEERELLVSTIDKEIGYFCLEKLFFLFVLRIDSVILWHSLGLTVCSGGFLSPR